VHPVIGKLPVASVDTAGVVKILETIWTSRPQTASRVRGRIESILDWAKVRGYRAGENPARWRGHLDHLLPAHRRLARVRHHAALPFADVPAFMSELREREGITARALEFTVLTAARVGEVLGARWNEISGDIWTVPTSRMKGGREHRVLLSTYALDLLKTLPRTSEYAFPGARGQIANNGPRKLLRRMGRSDITVHGFRSSFRDWAAETTHCPNHVVEMALAHAVGSAVEAAYRRGDLLDKRRRLMAEWSRYCTKGLNVRSADEVPLKGDSAMNSKPACGDSNERDRTVAAAGLVLPISCHQDGLP
jgi:integrase